MTIDKPAVARRVMLGKIVIVVFIGAVSVLLLIVVLGLAGVLNEPAGPLAPARQQPASVPPETQFCATLDATRDEYEPLDRKWYDEQNGIIKDQIAAKLTGIKNDRDKREVTLLSPSFQATNWPVSITEISGVQGGNTVSVTLRLLSCRLVATVQAEVLSGSASFAFLAKAKVGDQANVSGEFLLHDPDRQPAFKALEWSITEEGSIDQPEFRMAIAGLAPAGQPVPAAALAAATKEPPASQPAAPAAAQNGSDDALIRALGAATAHDKAAVQRAVNHFALAPDETRLAIVENGPQHVILALQYRYRPLLLPAVRVAAAGRALDLCRRVAVALAPNASAHTIDVIAVNPPASGWRGPPLFGAQPIAAVHYDEDGSDCALGPTPP